MADGAFRADLLPPGTYDLQASLSGFSTEILQNLMVTLGSRVAVEVVLRLTPVTDEILVTARAPLVETTNPGVTSSVSSHAIGVLPLEGRDFGGLVLLTPAAVTGRSAASEREICGGQGGVNIGARAIHTVFNIDGSNGQSSFFGNERGGQEAPFTFSQAAIEELQVLTASYDLQFSSVGGVVNAITRSGTNQLHGQVFAYVSDDRMVAENARGDEAAEFDQRQLGLALGGPLVRDRAHFFVAYDGQDLEEPSHREFVAFPVGREGEWEALTGLDWDLETGDLIAVDDADVVLAKVDWQLSPAGLLTVRENWMDSEADNRLNPYRTGGRSNNGLMENSHHSLVISLNTVVGDEAFNELILQHSREKRPRTPNVGSIPEALIGWYGSLGSFGQNRLTPNSLDEEHHQINDSLTVLAGRQTIKAGLNIDRVSFDNSFLRYGGGQYSYRAWEDFLDGRPNYYLQAFSSTAGQSRFSNRFYALYAQDEWRPSPGLTLILGLRYDYQDHDQPPTTNPLFPATGHIPDDGDNWAPRLGLAWDVDGSGRQVVRGGAGLFYGRTPAALDAQPFLVNGLDVVEVGAACAVAGACPSWPERWPSPAAVPPGQGMNIYAFDPDFENPQTLRLSLGYEVELLDELSLGVDVLATTTSHLHRNQDQNLEPSGELTVVGTPIYEVGTVYPELGRVVLFRSDAHSRSRSLVLRMRRRFTGAWFLDAAYTWSRSRDQDSNERSISLSRQRAEDQYDLDAEWGPSSFDVEHKVVVSGGARLAWGLTVSASFVARTGFPYTALHGSDLNRDGYRTDRAVVEMAPGRYDHHPRNGQRQPSFRTLNLRLARNQSIAGTELEIIAEVFNLLDRANWWISRANQVLSDGCATGGSGGPEPCTTLSSFGRRDIPGAPRRFQVGLRLRF